MRVYLIGSGGREDAIARVANRSPLVDSIIAAPGNPGISRYRKVERVPINTLDIEGHVKLACDLKVDLVICGPERPLGLGLANRMRAKDLRVFAPNQAHAKFESSKAWAKLLMWRRIPTAPYRTFDNPRHARNYLEILPRWPAVIKCDGYADGKGVRIAKTEEEAEAAIYDSMERKIFGTSGDRVVIEQFIRGREFSGHAVVSGTSFQSLPPTEDHKQVGEGDTGPMGGGSGVVVPTWVTPRLMQFVEERILGPAVKILASVKSSHPYAGILYPGMIYDQDDDKEPVKVLEFGTRFGDPEAENLLTDMRTDFIEICLLAAEGRPLPPIKFKGRFVATVILASHGYGFRPQENLELGFPISGIDEAEKDSDVMVYHCGTEMRDGELVTAGGRVLAVTASDSSYDGARSRAYRAVAKISFQGMTYRRDIGLRKDPALPRKWR